MVNCKSCEVATEEDKKNDGFREPLPGTAVKIGEDGGLLRWEEEKKTCLEQMPFGNAACDLMKRSSLTGPRTATLRLLAVLDKSWFPRTGYVQHGAGSEALSWFVDTIRPNLGTGGLPTRTIHLAKNPANAGHVNVSSPYRMDKKCAKLGEKLPIGCDASDVGRGRGNLGN